MMTYSEQVKTVQKSNLRCHFRNKERECYWVSRLVKTWSWCERDDYVRERKKLERDWKIQVRAYRMGRTEMKCDAEIKYEWKQGKIRERQRIRHKYLKECAFPQSKKSPLFSVPHLRRLIATAWAIRLLTDVQLHRQCGLERWWRTHQLVGPRGWGGGNMEVPFMTTSLMFAVSGQQAPESSESEINEREPQRRWKQSTQYECWSQEGDGEWIRINWMDKTVMRSRGCIVFVLMEKAGW